MSYSSFLNIAEGGGEYKKKRLFPALAMLAGIYLVAHLTGYHINGVILSIVLMISFCLLRIPVAIALICAAILGAMHSGLTVSESIGALNDNLLVGSQVGMTYIMIGAFAVALARSGLLDLMAQKIASHMGGEEETHKAGVKWFLFLLFMASAVMSQNAVPVHIAFIPVMIPPLLGVLNKLRVDRRAVACILACSISASYLLLPTGFGAIYLHEILMANVNKVGEAYDLAITASMAPKAMFWPVMGILGGMLFAVFITYRKPRDYETLPQYKVHTEKDPVKIDLTPVGGDYSSFSRGAYLST